MTPHWLDRVTAPIAPIWTLKRQRARVAGQLLQRHYEAAGTGRRQQGWRRSSGDANAAIAAALAPLRDQARDLVRNTPYAESAVSTICDHAVGWGIEAKPLPMNRQAATVWKEWAGTTACDADGRHNMAGLQKLVMRTVVESGECLVRRRLRRPEDGLPLPLQLQVLDPDFLDTTKEIPTLPNGGRVVQGVEFNPIGQRVAYWLYPEHPGSLRSLFAASQRVPAESIRHVFRPLRPGQVRGVSWFAPVLLRFKDFDEFEDATLMKQKIAACLAVLTTDVDGTASPVGNTTTDNPDWDFLEPGAIKQLAAGQTIQVVDPPQARDYDAYSKQVLRAIATGLGVTYEDLTGDYADMPFSAARMSRLRHWARVEDWRWRILIPQFCDPAWAWAMEAAVIMGQVREAPAAEWSTTPAPMIDPANEGLAYQRNIRTGIMSLSEAIRERGYDPATLLAEIAADNKLLDKLGLVLDCDARKMTQAGQLQSLPPAPVTEGEDAERRRLLSILHADDDDGVALCGEMTSRRTSDEALVTCPACRQFMRVRVGPTRLAR